MLAGTYFGVRRIAAAASASVLFAALSGSMPAAAAPAPAHIATAAVGGTCGSVEIGASASLDVTAALSCFAHAYANCDDARFSVAYHGADSGVARTFVTMRSAIDGSCSVAEVIDHYKGAAVQSSDTYLCTDLRQNSEGITFMRCGADGDVFVPSDLSSPNAKKLLTIASTYKPTA